MEWLQWLRIWTPIWLLRHWAWLRRGYWRYRNLIDWLIDVWPAPINLQAIYNAKLYSPGARRCLSVCKADETSYWWQFSCQTLDIQSELLRKTCYNLKVFRIFSTHEAHCTAIISQTKWDNGSGYVTTSIARFVGAYMRRFLSKKYLYHNSKPSVRLSSLVTEGDCWTERLHNRETNVQYSRSYTTTPSTGPKGWHKRGCRSSE